MRLGIGLALSVTLLFGGGPVQASHYPEADLQDVSGDANLLNQASVYISSPASYAAADLISVDLRTTYASVAVGKDGIDYRPTGMRVVFRTSDSPAAVLPGDEIVFRLEALGWAVTGQRADVFMEGLVAKSPTGAVSVVPRLKRDDGSCSSLDACWTRSKQEWSGEIDEAQKTLTLTYPFSSLAPDEADLIGVGAYLSTPDAETISRFSADAWLPRHRQTIDMALYGHGYVVGEDVPPDVACTQECETTSLDCFGGFFFVDDTLNNVIHFLSSINGACKSPHDVRSVKIWTTTKRCPSDGLCSDDTIARQCEGRKCGEKLTIPYEATEEAEYNFVFKWEFDDGDKFHMDIGRICHRGLLSGCEESTTRVIRF